MANSLQLYYYPFGMNITALSSSAPMSMPNRFKVQGKEEEKGFGLNTYDFHARMYDAAIGRTFQIDPHSSSYVNLSAYSWAANNPLSVVDPTGMDIIHIEGGVRFTGEDAKNTFTSMFGGGGCPTNDCNDENTEKSSEGQQSENTEPKLRGKVKSIQDMNGVPISKNNFELAQLKADYEIHLTMLTILAILDGLADSNFSGTNPKGYELEDGTQVNLAGREVLLKLPRLLKNLKNLKSVEAKAKAISQALGKNSISLRSGRGLKRFDLVGRSHGGVPTPHVQAYKNNYVDGVIRNVSRVSKKADEATMQDIRMIVNYLKSLK